MLYSIQLTEATHTSIVYVKNTRKPKRWNAKNIHQRCGTEFAQEYRVTKTHRMPKLQVIFRRRATHYRALSRTMSDEDKAPYDTTPPCIKTFLKVSSLLYFLCKIITEVRILNDQSATGISWEFLYIYIYVYVSSVIILHRKYSRELIFKTHPDLVSTLIQGGVVSWCFIFIGHFPQKSPIMSGSSAKNDLQLKHPMSLRLIQGGVVL